jgi:hypothetical protein
MTSRRRVRSCREPLRVRRRRPRSAGRCSPRVGRRMWGTATVHTDVDTKRRLWTGVFTYNLDDFAPEGPESADKCFIAVHPERALALKQYGMAGRDTWRAP